MSDDDFPFWVDCDPDLSLLTVHDWCRDNCGEYFEIESTLISRLNGSVPRRHQCYSRLRIGFENGSDATLFKMRWCGA